VCSEAGKGLLSVPNAAKALGCHSIIRNGIVNIWTARKIHLGAQFVIRYNPARFFAERQRWKTLPD
jgi:hypothetical protein